MFTEQRSELNVRVKEMVTKEMTYNLLPYLVTQS